ncbi:MAG: 6-pyruvoyl trahydropterin synthase family protein [Marinifilaceae bacterium]
MIIRKLYRFEGAHRVRSCSSVYCRDNIHGHSYIVEVFITSDKLDNGCMVLDFGLLKPVKEFIESFDHAYSLWDKEETVVKEAIRIINPRHVEMPISPSSEGFALLFFYVIDQIIASIPRNNGEGDVRLHAIRVHETATGYAEAHREDLKWIDFNINQIKFSKDIVDTWSAFNTINYQ